MNHHSDNRLPATLDVLVYHDDSDRELNILKNVLEQNSKKIAYSVRGAAHKEDLFWSLKNEELPHIVLISLDERKIADDQNYAIIREVRRLYPKGVIITGSYGADAQTIIGCLECGVDDYISKQVDLRHLPQDLFNIYQRTHRRNQRTSHSTPGIANFVGKTMKEIDSSIPHIVDSAIGTIFVQGESGTGKEVVADLFKSRLPEGVPFIKVNCGAIAPSLVEAEFFGYIKGAFTGASSSKVGYLEKASGGWLFLDEVTTLSKPAQAALLRAIENQEIIRVGDSQPVKISVRFIAATNEDINALVAEGKFRLDLWQRLTDKIIHLPPLRERAEEVDEIIRFLCQTMRGGPYTITDPTMDILTKLPWKQGNIRQLRNCLRAMTEKHADKILTPVTIPPYIRQSFQKTPEPRPHLIGAPKCSITLSWDQKGQPGYEELADSLLIELVLKAAEDPSVKSIRRLSQEVGMVRTTLTNRLKAIQGKPLGNSNQFKKIQEQFLN